MEKIQISTDNEAEKKPYVTYIKQYLFNFSDIFTNYNIYNYDFVNKMVRKDLAGLRTWVLCSGMAKTIMMEFFQVVWQHALDGKIIHVKRGKNTEIRFLIQSLYIRKHVLMRHRLKEKEVNLDIFHPAFNQYTLFMKTKGYKKKRTYMIIVPKSYRAKIYEKIKQGVRYGRILAGW